MLTFQNGFAKPVADSTAGTLRSADTARSIHAQAAALAPVAPATVQAAPVAPSPETAPAASAARMIMLRRNESHWLIRILGVTGLSAEEMPLPFTRQESLRAVLGHLASNDLFAGKLSGCWLLVAP